MSCVVPNVGNTRLLLQIAVKTITSPSTSAIPSKLPLGSLRQVCSHRHWTLLAAHVRTNHVHLVLEADQSAEQAMNTIKSYASRALNQRALDSTDRRRWARHGSTRHLWTKDAVSAAVHYVVSGQGEPMAVWQPPDTQAPAQNRDREYLRS